MNHDQLAEVCTILFDIVSNDLEEDRESKLIKTSSHPKLRDFTIPSYFHELSYGERKKD